MNAVVARVLVAVTIGAAAAVLFGPPPLAVAGGIALGFALPGLALTAVLFRGRTLSAVERTVLAPGLSLAVLVVSGLAIYAAGFALDRIAWTSATAGVAVLALIVPAVGKSGRAQRRAAAKEADRHIAELAAAAAMAVQAAAGPGEQRAGGEADATIMLPAIRDTDMTQQFVLPPFEVPQVKPLVAKPRPPLKRIFRQLVPLVLVAAVLGGASWLSLRSSHDSYDVTVTTLSAAVPGPVSTTGTRVVAVSASGLVAADGPYTVRVSSADGVQTEKRSVAVPAGGTWTARLTMPGRQRMTVNLYRSGDTTAYRTLYIAASQ